jgi:hypothetical protein
MIKKSSGTSKKQGKRAAAGQGHGRPKSGSYIEEILAQCHKVGASGSWVMTLGVAENILVALQRRGLEGTIELQEAGKVVLRVRRVVSEAAAQLQRDPFYADRTDLVEILEFLLAYFRGKGFGQVAGEQAALAALDAALMYGGDPSEFVTREFRNSEARKQQLVPDAASYVTGTDQVQRLSQAAEEQPTDEAERSEALAVREASGPKEASPLGANEVKRGRGRPAKDTEELWSIAHGDSGATAAERAAALSTLARRFQRKADQESDD